MENWKEGIDANYTDSIKDFESIGDLVKDYHTLKSTPKGLVVPDDNGDWDKFYNQLGRPTDKRYINVEDKEREGVAPYEEIFYNSGLSKKQGEKLLTALIEKANNDYKANEAANQKFKDDYAKKLKDKYGDNLESTMNLVNSTLSTYGDTDGEIKNLIESGQTPIGFLDLMVNVGKSLAPDKLITGQSKTTLSGKEVAQKEIDKLNGDKTFMQKYQDKAHPKHEEAVKMMQKLYEQAYASE